MSLNSAALKFLVGKGFDGDDLVAFAMCLEEAYPVERSPAAKRQARYRAKKIPASVTGDVTSYVTESVTSPPKENISNPPSSEAKASGSVAADPVKELFDVGVSVLVGAGQSEKQARSLIGRWRKDRSDGEVLTGLIDCRTRAISNPVEWLTRRFAGSQYVSPSGYEYRGSLEQIEREAKRRHDTSTIWQIELDRKQMRSANA